MNKSEIIEPKAGKVEKPNDLDLLIAELGLEEECGSPECEERRVKLVEYLRAAISERKELDELVSGAGKDARVKKFIEKLLKGESGEEAFASSGLSELIENDGEELPETEDDKSEEIARFYAAKGVSEEVIEEFVAFVEGFIAKIYDEPVDADVLEVLWLAFMFEDEVRRAYDKGCVAGQNKRIESLRFERNNVDGLGPVGGGAVPKTSPKPAGYIERLMKNS